MGNTFSQSKIKRKFTKRSKSLQSKRSFRSFKSFKSFKSSKSSRTFSFQSQSFKSFEISEHTSKKNEPLKYYLANYEKDTDIMVIFHFLGCYLFQSAFSAPVEEKLATHECCKVLDVGCGAGTWILNLAATYRTSIFIGIDICTVYPSEIKPDNVAFMQGDTLNGLPYEDNTFDFVHQGNMLCVFTTPEWEFVISELVRVCKPGGYIEFTEPELASNTGPILTRFYEALIEHSNSRNVEIRISKDVIKILKSLPTVRNVEYKTSTVSLGYTKGGNAGQAYFEVHDGFFLNEPMPDSMHKIMGLSKEEYLELFNEAKKEVNNGIAPDCDIYRIWCQKV